MSGQGRWSDLLPRTLSAVVLVGAGALALYAGGLVFSLLVALFTGAVMWELFRMLAPEQGDAALNVGILSAAALTVASLTVPVVVPVLLLVPVALGLIRIRQDYPVFASMAIWVMIGAFGIIWLRDSHGLIWTLWLISVVVVTDIAGYFVGKHIGGPKFWPRVSPKKTWSGTAGGWVGAALVGAVFALFAGLPGALILLSVGVSLASQMGDIVESAMKRRMGVKDSSQLIPGHGGVFDRFDGMLGASALCVLVMLFWG
ncbi:phosphatidate cytidylyltransferase [Phaeobacter sp. HF9A]|uniref:phosphatidate cytidylyltransferase n=1 Tax=Phaeobacter sp. HF9A TaxID=2721561 RepID=UPI0014312C3E|nr:phosphatidate cytidylyltransferase [Phaeobacter sp. HF9A]NIZ14859.1 phosphatidate cytidylyltransferase [Phaeobacter sp. HF9A]